MCVCVCACVPHKTEGREWKGGLTFFPLHKSKKLFSPPMATAFRPRRAGAPRDVEAEVDDLCETMGVPQLREVRKGGGDG